MFDKVLDHLKGKFLRFSDLLIFSDFDGTLSPIVTDVNKAYAEPSAADALIEADLNDHNVVLVTGRPLDVLDRLVNHHRVQKGEKPHTFSGIGQHGMEMRRGGKATESPLTKEEESFLSDLKSSITKVVLDLLNSKGISLEDIKIGSESAREENIVEVKPCSITLHWRALQDTPVNRPDDSVITEISEKYKEIFEAKIKEHNMGDSFQVMLGHCTYEIKYKKMDKGIAMQTVIDDKQFAGKHLLYFGDDFVGTDGPAAELIHERRGIVIQVLNPNDPDSKKYKDPEPDRNRTPDFVVDSPKELGELIKAMKNLSPSLKPR